MNSLDFFISPKRRLYSNRITALLMQWGVTDDIKHRLEKYYDEFVFDEVQDIAGRDFNFLPYLVNTDIRILFVGDFYQYTFDTSRDGNVNTRLHYDYSSYKSRFEQMGLDLDETTLDKSHRCSPTICNFIRNNLNINIYSHRSFKTEIRFIEDADVIEEIMKNNEIVKLFLKENTKYQCFSRNWGESKGEDNYADVCVVLNSNTARHYRNGSISNLPRGTINKLYVALTRASGNVYLINETAVQHYKR